MNDPKRDLIDMVLRIAFVRRRREHQLKELRKLQQERLDLVEIKRELESSRELLRSLSAQRKKLAEKVVRGEKPKAFAPLERARQRATARALRRTSTGT